MSDEDTDQSILEWNSGCSRDLCDYSMGFYRLYKRYLKEYDSVRHNSNVSHTHKTIIYRRDGNRADRQLPVMSLELIVIVGVKETFPKARFGFLLGLNRL